MIVGEQDDIEEVIFFCQHNDLSVARISVALIGGFMRLFMEEQRC